ncbi:MAG: WYL domain-containing protein [Methylotenera sp.]|nr:WYL domain-containing protein [Methylotenera sp.]
MAKKLDTQRLHLMELLLRWEGQIGNARLRQMLRLSSIRASQWLREFREYQPNWTQWNSISRSFNATPEFYRDKHEDDSGSLAKYLSLVGLPATTDSESQHVVVAAFPDITTPNPYIFAVLSSASRMGRAVEVTYRSMRDPAPHKRIISPHSIIRAGRRWHVRAYCELNKQFRDYTLGRISHAVLLDQPAGSLIGDDKDWATEVPVRLIAHPGLSQEQQAVICFEYFKDTSSRTTTCRVPLVNYYIQDVRAAVDIETQRPPEYQLAIGNVKEIKKWLF